MGGESAAVNHSSKSYPGAAGEQPPNIPAGSPQDPGSYSRPPTQSLGRPPAALYKMHLLRRAFVHRPWFSKGAKCTSQTWELHFRSECALNPKCLLK